MTHFTLSAHRVFRAMRCISEEESRYYLHGFLIEPVEGGGALIIATDGRVMLIQHDKDASGAVPMILKVTKPPFTPWEDEFGYIHNDEDWTGKRLHIPTYWNSDACALPVSFKDNAPHDHVLGEKIDAKFVNWRSALGKPQITTRYKGHALGLDPHYLNKLADGNTALRLHGDLQDHTPVLITYGDDPDSIGVINHRYMTGKTCHLNDMLTLIGRADLVAERA